MHTAILLFEIGGWVTLAVGMAYQILAALRGASYMPAVWTYMGAGFFFIGALGTQFLGDIDGHAGWLVLLALSMELLAALGEYLGNKRRAKAGA